MAKKGRKPSTQRKGYFFEAEEEAVKQYLEASTKEEKDHIYETVLRSAFEKMINSIIRRYVMYIPDEEYDQTFNDTLSYLLTKLGNFNPDKGCKAYSYCGTVARNYLKYKKFQYIKKTLRDLPYEEMMDDLNGDTFTVGDETSFKTEAPDLIKDTARGIEEMIREPQKNNLNDNEVKVGIALVELLDNWEEIFIEGSNKMNKSSVLYFLREETMMTTKELRDNMRKYRGIYRVLRDAALS